MPAAAAAAAQCGRRGINGPPVHAVCPAARSRAGGGLSHRRFARIGPDGRSLRARRRRLVRRAFCSSSRPKSFCNACPAHRAFDGWFQEPSWPPLCPRPALHCKDTAARLSDACPRRSAAAARTRPALGRPGRRCPACGRQTLARHDRAPACPRSPCPAVGAGRKAALAGWTAPEAMPVPQGGAYEVPRLAAGAPSRCPRALPRAACSASPVWTAQCAMGLGTTSFSPRPAWRRPCAHLTNLNTAKTSP